MSQWASAFSIQKKLKSAPGTCAFFSFHVKWQKFSLQSRERESQPWWKKKKKACIEKPERECELHQSFCESSGRPWLSRTEKVHLTCLCTGRPAGREKHRDHESSFLSEPLLNSYDQRWDLLGTVHWPFSNNTRALLCSLFYFLPIIKGRICPVGRVTSAARCHSEPAYIW